MAICFAIRGIIWKLLLFPSALIRRGAGADACGGVAQGSVTRSAAFDSLNENVGTPKVQYRLKYE